MSGNNETPDVYGLSPLASADKTILTNVSLQVFLFSLMFPLFLLVRKKLKWLYTPNISKRVKHPLYTHRGWFNWITPLYLIEDPQLLYLIGLDSFIFLITLRMIIKIFVLLSITVAIPLCIIYYLNTIDSTSNFFFKISIVSIGGDYRIVALGVILSYGASFVISYFVFIQTKKLIDLRQIYIQNPALLTSIYQVKKIEWRLQSKEKMLDYINTPTRTVMIRCLPKDINTEKKYREFMESLNIGKIENTCLLKDSKKLENLINLQRKTVTRIEYELQAGYINLRRFVKNRIKVIREGNPEFDQNLIEKEDQEYVNSRGSLHSKKETTDMFVYDSEEKKRLFFKFMKNEKLPAFAALNLLIAELHDIMEEIDNEINTADPEEQETESENTGDSTVGNSSVVEEAKEIVAQDFLTYRDLLQSPSSEISNKSHITGFVTYENINSATIASQCLISNKPYECYSEIAPPPKDILWGNLNKDLNAITVSRSVSSAIFVLYCLTFIGIVLFIIGSIDLDVLISVMDKFKITSDWKELIKASIDGIFAPVVFNLFITLSAYVIKFFVKLELRSSYSHEQIQLMKKHMNFLIYEVVLGTYLGSTIMNLLITFFKTHNFDFNEIIDNLSVNALTVSLLFTNIVIQRCLMGVISILMKYGSLFKILYVPFTYRDKLEYRRPQAIDFGLLYPAIIIVMPMCMINLIIAPLLIVLGLIYFLLIYFVLKHELLYSLINECESGGTHWPFFVDFIFNVLLLTQLFTFCFFLNSKAKGLAVIFLPLMFITYFFRNSLLSEIKGGFANLPLKNTLDNKYTWEWDYGLEIERDSLEIDLIYKCDAEYIYEDLTVGRIHNRILLPQGFFRSIKYIEDNDKSEVLGFS
ncbi:CSC1-like protein [Cucumispora dikerogammari]|nr:CSC1-like protein [Cucumispora dikerogammari]